MVPSLLLQRQLHFPDPNLLVQMWQERLPVWIQDVDELTEEAANLFFFLAVHLCLYELSDSQRFNRCCFPLQTRETA